ncbi:hypothetical protein ZWY2020_004815 [Hordeum vulgare]|nr:hypothetical protein ZWY2020_004815 [Hordeum vulgare]
MPWFDNYRFGETLDDERLCITSVEDQVMRVWVHGETTWSDDNGWHLEREMNLTKVYDMVSSLHKDKCLRIFSAWLNDLVAGRTGKLFIRTTEALLAHMQLWLLAGLDLSTLHFSYMLAPTNMPWFDNYRIGETLEDGRLCIPSVEDQVMRVWVHGETTWIDDNGWHVEREMNLTKVYDMVSSLHKDRCLRIFSVWLNDLDAGRTSKLFIRTTASTRCCDMSVVASPLRPPPSYPFQSPTSRSLVVILDGKLETVSFSDSSQ